MTTRVNSSSVGKDLLSVSERVQGGEGRAQRKHFLGAFLEAVFEGSQRGDTRRVLAEQLSVKPTWEEYRARDVLSVKAVHPAFLIFG